MNRKYLNIILTFFILAAINNVNATPISASLGFNADAKLALFDGITITDAVIDSQSSSWGTLLDPLSVSASAAATDSTQSITVSGSANATWGGDGNSGNISFQDFGWEGTAHNYTADLRNGISGDTWSYTFIADMDGVFSMSYDVSIVDAIGEGGSFGLRGWNIEWSGAGGGLSLVNALDPTASGIFTRNIIAGQIYTVGLSDGPSLAFGSSSTLDFSKHVQGDFTFSMVPEPTSIALFVLGLMILIIRAKRHRNS